jgi:hypothetical protein
MRRVVLAPLVALLGIGIGLGPAHAQKGPFERFSDAAPRVGDPAPDVALRTPDGRPVRLSEPLARAPVVLVFGSFS